MPSDHDIGTGKIRLEVERSKVKPELDKAKEDVERVTKDAGDAAERNLGGGFQRAGEKIEGSTASARKLAGALSSTWGIVTGLTGTLSGLAGIFFLLVTRAETLRDRFQEIATADIGVGKWDRLLDIGDQLVKVPGELSQDVAWERARREVNSLQGEYEELIEVVKEGKKPLAGLGQIGGAGAAERAAKAEARISEIRARQAELAGVMSKRALEVATAQEAATKAAEAEAKAKEQALAAQSELDARRRTAEAIAAEVAAMGVSLLDPIEQVEVKAAQTMARIAELRDQFTQEELDKFYATVEAKKQAEIKAIRDAEAARKRAEDERAAREAQARRDKESRERESAERQADALAKAMSAAIDRIGASVDSLNDNTSETLTALLQRVEILVNNAGYG